MTPPYILGIKYIGYLHSWYQFLNNQSICRVPHPIKVNLQSLLDIHQQKKIASLDDCDSLLLRVTYKTQVGHSNQHYIASLR